MVSKTRNALVEWQGLNLGIHMKPAFVRCLHFTCPGPEGSRFHVVVSEFAAQIKNDARPSTESPAVKSDEPHALLISLDRKRQMRHRERSVRILHMWKGKRYKSIKPSHCISELLVALYRIMRALLILSEATERYDVAVPWSRK